MAQILSLDCTLRDGGYCNRWRFKENNIKSIINGLIAARIDIVECGFLTNTIEYDKDVTKYTDICQLDNFIPKHNSNTSFVLMVNYGEYNISDFPERKDTSIDGIRLAFHKTSYKEAILFCKKLQDKGYDIYLQPMVTVLYTLEEFKDLIRQANDIEPRAFYIVDSFGTMREDDLLKYYRLAECMLAPDIELGFHSHNNLQTAFSNAKLFAMQETDRTIIIDCSIYGMGRGAGNLNAELFLNELNNKYNKGYDIKPLLKIMDEVISVFYNENAWGYSLPNYLSAVHIIHPNYTLYLTEKNSLMLDDIDEIFSMMDPEKSVEYDEGYIESLYLKYMINGVIKNGHLFELKERIKNKKILFIAPGKSAFEFKDDIREFVNDNKPIIISINHEYDLIKTDYVFVSNKRRFSQLPKKVYSKTISTSNIQSGETYASVDYYKLLNPIDEVCDNAGLMAIKLAIDELKPSEIFIAGLDGYNYDAHINYGSENLVAYMSWELMNKINYGMKTVIDEYSKKKDISFITPTILR